MQEIEASARNDEAFEELYGVSDSLLERLKYALENQEDHHDLRTITKDLHAADFADLIEQLDHDLRIDLVQKLGETIDSEVISHLDYSIRLGLLKHLPLSKLALWIDALESDDAIDIIEDLSEEDQRNLLLLIPAEDRAVYEQGLSYLEDSAGRLMRKELVTIPNFWTVGQTIDFLRTREHDEIPDDFYSLIIVGPHHKPVGLLKLSRLLVKPRYTAIAAIMDKEPKLIPVDLDQEDVAFLFQQYALLESPVVDEAGRLVGSITIDDIVDVIHEEHQEDMLSMAGVQGNDYYSDIMRTIYSRSGWLLINLFTAIIASMVIGLFEQSLQQLVALAILMPIVASMGGNAGTQTLTVAVRALATNTLTPSNAGKIILKETVVGGSNGVIFAMIIGLIAWIWFDSAMLGLVIGLSMIINLLMAGLAGILIPIMLEYYGEDPAISSSIVLTTATDIIGFLSFLGLASLLLL